MGNENKEEEDEDDFPSGNQLSYSCRVLPIENINSKEDEKVKRRYSVSDDKNKRFLTVVHEALLEESELSVSKHK